MVTSIKHNSAWSRKVSTVLRSVLPPNVNITQGKATGSLLINGYPLTVEWVGDGWLSDVQDVLEKVDKPDLVVGRRLSPGARKALADARVNWADETGAAAIAIGTIIVSKVGLEISAPKQPRWTNAGLAVAEAILLNVEPAVSATAVATRLSTGSCVNALRLLTDLGLLAADAKRGRKSGRRIVDRDRLLDAYAAASVPLRKLTVVTVGVTWRDTIDGLIDVGTKWTKQGVVWAATGAVAASVLAPHLSDFGSADVYVNATTLAELADIATMADLKPIEGGRLRLAPFPTTTSQRMMLTVDNLPIVPWPRVFADLRTVGVRGEDAAEHLREVNNVKR